MNRKLPVLALVALAALLLAACSTSRPVVSGGTTCPPDPRTEPTAAGAAAEAAAEAAEDAEAGARVGRRVGVVAGMIAAVLGGPERESLDDAVDRYRRTRDAATVAGAIIGAATGGVEEVKRGYELDVQFAELLKIDGLEVTRPAPDAIDVRFLVAPDQQLLADIAAVLKGRGERVIDVEAPGDVALELRESLIDLGLPASSLNAHRVDGLTGAGIVLRIRLRAAAAA